MCLLVREHITGNGHHEITTIVYGTIVYGTILYCITTVLLYFQDGSHLDFHIWNVPAKQIAAFPVYIPGVGVVRGKAWSFTQLAS